jgi:hypothetical protein
MSKQYVLLFRSTDADNKCGGISARCSDGKRGTWPIERKAIPQQGETPMPAPDQTCRSSEMRGQLLEPHRHDISPDPSGCIQRLAGDVAAPTLLLMIL